MLRRVCKLVGRYLQSAIYVMRRRRLLLVSSDCNSGNSEFRISGISVFFSPEIPGFFLEIIPEIRDFHFLHYLPSCLIFF